MAKTSALDLAGKTFGRLTVLERIYPNTPANKVRWRCECSCGNFTIAVAGAIKGGHTVSCGCAQKDAVRHTGCSNLDDLTGKIFHRLTVLSRADNNSRKKPSWTCRCSCGTVKAISASDLKSGSSKSCGCYIREICGNVWRTHGLSRTPEYLKAKRQRKHKRDMADPVKALAIRVKDLIRKSIEFKGFVKNTKTASILGCSPDEFRAHIEKQFVAGMSWDNFRTIDLDHIVPMATAETEEDVYRLNHYSNFSPLFKDDNRDKSDKIGYVVGSTEPNNGISYRVLKKSLAISNQVAYNAYP